MPIDEMYGEIREVFIAQCEPHQFEEPWDFLPSHDDVRCLPAEPASLTLSRQGFTLPERPGKTDPARDPADRSLSPFPERIGADRGNYCRHPSQNPAGACS